MLFAACWLFVADLHAEAPPLLADALAKWNAGRKDLAFTQLTTTYGDDDRVRRSRLERYDPSLPADRRWRLLEVNGRPATDSERRDWEQKRNSRARKQGGKSPVEYLDLQQTSLLDENGRTARFEVGIRPEVSRLAALEKLSVIITVDKGRREIAHVAARLSEPMKIAWGLARVTDVDFDLHVEVEDGLDETDAAVKPGGTARVVMSKLGSPMEYRWSDFKRVTSHDS